MLSSAVRIALGGPGRGLLLKLLCPRQHAVTVPAKAEELPIPALDLRRRVLQLGYIGDGVGGVEDTVGDGDSVDG